MHAWLHINTLCVCPCVCVCVCVCVCLCVSVSVCRRFTCEIAPKAKSVVAVDFMQDFIKRNEQLNKHFGNIEFLCADVTHMTREKERWVNVDDDILSVECHFVKAQRNKGQISIRKTWAVGGWEALSWHVRIFREGLMNQYKYNNTLLILEKEIQLLYTYNFSHNHFLFYFWKKRSWNSSHTQILLFRPGSVHSGSVNWDDCRWVFPDELFELISLIDSYIMPGHHSRPTLTI